jgi:hypothetical protein
MHFRELIQLVRVFPRATESDMPSNYWLTSRAHPMYTFRCVTDSLSGGSIQLLILSITRDSTLNEPSVFGGYSISSGYFHRNSALTFTFVVGLGVGIALGWELRKAGCRQRQERITSFCNESRDVVASESYTGTQRLRCTLDTELLETFLLCTLGSRYSLQGQLRVRPEFPRALLIRWRWNNLS